MLCRSGISRRPIRPRYSRTKYHRENVYRFPTLWTSPRVVKRAFRHFRFQTRFYFRNNGGDVLRMIYKRVIRSRRPMPVAMYADDYLDPIDGKYKTLSLRIARSPTKRSAARRVFWSTDPPTRFECVFTCSSLETDDSQQVGWYREQAVHTEQRLSVLCLFLRTKYFTQPRVKVLYDFCFDFLCLRRVVWGLDIDKIAFVWLKKKKKNECRCYQANEIENSVWTSSTQRGGDFVVYCPTFC